MFDWSKISINQPVLLPLLQEKNVSQISDNKNIFQNNDQVLSKDFIKIGEENFKLDDQ